MKCVLPIFTVLYFLTGCGIQEERIDKRTARPSRSESPQIEKKFSAQDEFNIANLRVTVDLKKGASGCWSNLGKNFPIGKIVCDEDVNKYEALTLSHATTLCSNDSSKKTNPTMRIKVECQTTTILLYKFDPALEISILP